MLDELSIMSNGVFVRGEKIVAHVQSKLFAIAHEGEMGQMLTNKRIRVEFWWPGMDEELVQWVERCVECMECEKRLKVGCQVDFQSIHDPGQVWHTACGDFIGPKDGLRHARRFALVLLDVQSSWLVVTFMAEITTSSAINELSVIFKEEEYPMCLITDNGTQLVLKK